MHINGVAQLRVVTSRQIEKDRLSNLLLYLKNETFLEMVGHDCIENNRVTMLVNIAYSHVTLLKIRKWAQSQNNRELQVENNINLRYLSFSGLSALS